MLLALLLDLAFGEAPNSVHPLRWMGNLLGWLDRRIARRGRASTRAKGALSYLLVLGISSSAALALLAAARACPGPWGEAAWIAVTALSFKVSFAVSSFRRHCRPIAEDLEAGDVDSAARRVQMIVSRDTRGMDAEHIASSCAETVSENYVDSVVSPATYFGLLGVPGAAMFRCANLMDAMWGYMDERHRDLGWFPAKLDDALGYVTSRVSPLFVAAGALLLGMDWRAAVPAARREHGKTPSPNSGWPMTAFAAALGVSMEKEGVYVMGSGPLPSPRDVSRCCRLLEVSSALYITAVALPLYMFVGIHVQALAEGLFAGLLGVLA